MPSADAANAVLGQALNGGLTLVLSYWSDKTVEKMAWLDAPCTPGEINQWQCHDAWTERRGWPWTCDKQTRSYDPPACGASFHLSNLRVDSGMDVSRVLVAGLVVALMAAYAYMHRGWLQGKVRLKLRGSHLGQIRLHEGMYMYMVRGCTWSDPPT